MSDVVSTTAGMAPALQSVADCGAGDAGDVHGHFGHFHRRGGAAVYRRQSWRDTGRIHLGADELPGGQCGHPSGERLVLQLFRPQTISGRLHRVVHRGFADLWCRDLHADAGRLPGLARPGWRRHAAACPGHPVGKFSAHPTRHGHGLVRIWASWSLPSSVPLWAAG